MKKKLIFIAFILSSVLSFAQYVKDINFDYKQYNNTISLNLKLPDPFDPSELVAAAVSNSRINISWKRNEDNNDVLIAYSVDGVFGIPVYGKVYNKFDEINEGGTVLYVGSAEISSHSSLNEATRYYYKAWSVKNSTPDYSEGIVTNEVTHGPPFVSKPVITSITLSSADAQAIVISENGASITEKGFVYSLFTNPTVDNNKITVDDESFETTLETLNSYTQYFVKAYAINLYGVGYSKEEDFTTSTITGVNNIEVEKFRVFPNPSDGRLNLIFPVKFKSAIVLLINLKGNKVFYKEINENNSIINLPEKLKGLYILQVKSSVFFIEKKIIIK